MADILNDTDVKRRKSSFAGKIEVTGPNGNTRVVALEEMSEADAALAAKFGYKPVFKRVSQIVEIFSEQVRLIGM